MKRKFKVKYVYQFAGWIATNGLLRSPSIFPTSADALEEAKRLNAEYAQ